MLKISHTGWLSLSPVILAQFILRRLSQPEMAENLLKRNFWRIFGRSEFLENFGGLVSFEVIDVCTLGKLVSSTSYDKQQVCAYLQPFSL